MLTTLFVLYGIYILVIGIGWFMWLDNCFNNTETKGLAKLTLFIPIGPFYALFFIIKLLYRTAYPEEEKKEHTCKVCGCTSEW